MHRIIIRDIKQLPEAALKIIEYSSEKKVIAFYGSMGAGKTTIIKAVCMVINVETTVSSPTFTLVNEYLTPSGSTLYHIDLYRLNDKTEALDFGIEEYFQSGSYCFLEWPEIIEDILPENTVRIRITVTEDETRILDFF